MRAVSNQRLEIIHLLAGDDLAFLAERHAVRTEDLLRNLQSWTDGVLSTERFHRWLVTADTDEGSREKSIALHLIDNLEWLTEEVAAAEPDHAQLAATFRTARVRTFTERLSRIAAEESEPGGACPPELYERVDDALTAMYDTPELLDIVEIAWRAPEGVR